MISSFSTAQSSVWIGGVLWRGDTTAQQLDWTIKLGLGYEAQAPHNRTSEPLSHASTRNSKQLTASPDSTRLDPMRGLADMH